MKQWLIALLFLSLLSASGVIYFRSINRQAAAIEQLTAKKNRQIERLTAQRRALELKYRKLRYIHDLAIEFSFDPSLVSLVDHYSKMYVDSAGTEWRFVKNHEFMTHLMLSLIFAESKGNPRARSDGGKARGLTQIWTSTARQYVEELGEVTAEELLDPEMNLKFSFRHFQELLRDFQGNVTLALLAWNRGASRVRRIIASHQDPANGFAQKVYLSSLDHNKYSPFRRFRAEQSVW